MPFTTPEQIQFGLRAATPIAYWSFDQGDARDDSGHGHTGTLTNATIDTGWSGGGLRVRGGTSYAEIAASPTLAPSTAVTVTAWARIDSQATWHSAIVYKSGGTPTTSGFADRAYTLWAQRGTDGPNGLLLAYTGDGASRQHWLESKSTSIGTGYAFYAMTVDLAAHSVTGYINGVKVVEETGVSESKLLQASGALRIGAPFYTLSDQSGIDGVVDEVRIYDVALSAAEIRQVMGMTSTDVIRSGDVTNDTLTGGLGNDTLVGGDGDDSLVSLAGRDVIYAGMGNDTIYAGLDNDTVYGGRGDDYVYGGQGDDHIESGIGADTIESGLGNDTVLAGQDNDLVLAGQGNDSVLGGLGNDTLKGGLGNDTIGGNGGDDLLYGNDGADLFVLTSASGADTIADFNAAAGDRILITAGTTYTVSDASGGALLAFSGGGTLLLEGIASGAVTAALFTTG